ncbi:MAG: LysE family transporter [Pseudomonadota bacterium]
MTALASLLPLIGFVFAATASPGGATTLVTASGTRFGYVGSIPLMAGICLGMCSLTAAIAGGLGAVLLAFPTLELALRLIGSLYLLYFAWMIARQGAPAA